MFLEFFAPQGLKGPTAAIQGVEFGGSSPFTAQVAPLDFGSFNTSVIGHRIFANSDFFTTKTRKDENTKNIIKFSCFLNFVFSWYSPIIL
jgi:hypothetical protein